jgi:hypothetical protein
MKQKEEKQKQNQNKKTKKERDYRIIRIIRNDQIKSILLRWVRLSWQV